MLTFRCFRSNSAKLPSISPGDGDGDVARHASREIDDLVADAIVPRFQVVGPELEYFLWNPRQRVFPARLLLIDGAALVGAQRVREPIHLHFRQSVSHRSLSARFSASTAVARRAYSSAFSASLRAASLWICFALGMRSSMLSGMAEGS